MDLIPQPSSNLNIERSLDTIARALLSNNLSLGRNPVKFAAYRNAGYTTGAGAGAGFSPFVFDVKAFDTGTNYNAATGQFTAPDTGYYQFFATLSSFNLPADQLLISLQKNGVLVYSGTLDKNSTGANATLSVVCAPPPLLLAKGDVITVSSNHTQAYAMGYTATQAACNFGGFLVSYS